MYDLGDQFLLSTNLNLVYHYQVLFTEHVGNKFIYFFSSRLYTEIFGIASVGSWYGIWTAFDTIVGANTLITVIIVILSYTGLLYTKTVRNITASPFAIITDRKQGYFDVPTLFQWSFHVSKPCTSLVCYTFVFWLKYFHKLKTYIDYKAY